MCVSQRERRPFLSNPSKYCHFISHNKRKSILQLYICTSMLAYVVSAVNGRRAYLKASRQAFLKHNLSLCRVTHTLIAAATTTDDQQQTADAELYSIEYTYDYIHIRFGALVESKASTKQHQVILCQTTINLQMQSNEEKSKLFYHSVMLRHIIE